MLPNIGLRLVQAALQANSSITKNEKTTNIDTAKKIYDSGDRNGAPYNNKLNDEFLNYDSSNNIINEEKNKHISIQKRGFWGRTINTTTSNNSTTKK